VAPGIIDHLLVALLVLVVPWLAVIEYRHLVRALEAGVENARPRAYRQTVLVQWGFTACLIGLWIQAGRPLLALGLGLEMSRGLWIGLSITVAACGFLVFQTVMVQRHPEARAAVRAQVETLRPLLPHTVGEGRWFAGVSVTAGTCEEVVYRGFLMAYFGGLGPIPAILLSTLVFGLSHAYMGRAGAIRASLVGLIVAGLYWLTGSLWAPMLLHATADLTSGIMARTSFAGEPLLSDGESLLPPPPGAPR
jgi:membrane protease YdiL (CAAX protease family)